MFCLNRVSVSGLKPLASQVSLGHGLDWGLKCYFDFSVGTGTIWPPLTNKTVIAGKGVTFRCRVVRKNSAFRIRWKKNGVAVEQSTRIKITHQDWGSRLRIRDSSLCDAGVYQCVVKNRIGQKSTSIAMLTVRGREWRILHPIV